jgi:Fe-S-cluster-containing dehydrogenase component
LRRCTGCRSCTVACKAEFNVPLGAFRAAAIARATRRTRFRRVSKSARSIPRVAKSLVRLTAKQSDTVMVQPTNAPMA